MRITEILFESPQLVGPTDFALSNLARNRALARQLAKKSVETIEDTPNYEILRAGDSRNGNIVLIDRALRRIDYLVHYEEKRYRFLGTTVSQVKLWRRAGSAWVQGLTKRIFFDVLLARYPAVLSDGQQTANGRDFWLNRMVNGVQHGKRVGFVNMNTQHVIWYDPRVETFADWLDNNRQWGAEDAYQALRYIIAN